MASLFRIRSAAVARPSSIATSSLNSNFISSQFSSSPSETVSQASRIFPFLKNVESFTPLHRLNSPPGAKSKGFIVKTTPKISVVIRSLGRRNPGGSGESGMEVLTRGGETATPAKMTIALSTYDRPIFEDKFEGKRVRLPERRTVFTVLRSPHVHKKSREQFEIRVKKQLMVIQTTEKDEWKRKLFWLKNGRQFLN